MWWAAIKTFFTNRVLSTSGIFIGIFAIIIAVLVLSNASIILSKFGFETTANLKAEVATLQAELEQTKQINNRLNEDLANQTLRHKAELSAVTESVRERRVVRDRIVEVIVAKEVEDKAVIAELTDKMVITPTEITIPIEEYNQLSTNNINSINEVFDSLFPEFKEG